MTQRLLSFSVFFFFLSPFIFLMALTPGRFEVDTVETLWALKNSSLQAFYSTLITLLLGVITALGLFKVQNGRPALHVVLVILCLIPQFLPVVIVLITLMNGVQPFPMGLVGIVLCHAFSYFGMTALLIQNQANEVLPQFAEVARTLGSGRLLFWRKVGFPLLRKDLLLIALYLMAVFFTSFSIPLIVGGGRGTTLEVLIFEKMRLSSDWSPAVTLSLIQTLCMLLLSVLALKSRAPFSDKKRLDGWLGSVFGIAILMVIMASFFASYISGIIEGFSDISSLQLYRVDLFWAVINSLSIGFLTYCFIKLFMFIFSWQLKIPRYLETFLNGYVAPSTALTCFAILLCFPAEQGWSYVKIPLAFLLLSFPAAYRLGWGEKLNSLAQQVEVAQVLGASRRQIFSGIVWPQMKYTSHTMAGLVATWACGDFAVSRILSTSDFTLSLILESLLTSYRMGLASLLSLLLICVCMICFLIVMGFDYVNRRKFESK